MLTNLFNLKNDLRNTESHLDWIWVQGSRKLLEEHLGEAPRDPRIVLRN